VASLLNPYLNFDGNARQAMEFYQEALGGNLVLNTYGDMGGDHASAGDKIMHGMLETPAGFALMGADTPEEGEYNPGNNISVSLSGDDAADLRRYWEKLSAGGTVVVPMEKQMWGDEFGMCIDKFEITWMVNISQG
jgi:PhnB protein